MAQKRGVKKKRGRKMKLEHESDGVTTAETKDWSGNNEKTENARLSRGEASTL